MITNLNPCTSMSTSNLSAASLRGGASSLKVSSVWLLWRDEARSLKMPLSAYSSSRLDFLSDHPSSKGESNNDCIILDREKLFRFEILGLEKKSSLFRARLRLWKNPLSSLSIQKELENRESNSWIICSIVSSKSSRKKFAVRRERVPRFVKVSRVRFDRRSLLDDDTLRTSSSRSPESREWSLSLLLEVDDTRSAPVNPSLLPSGCPLSLPQSWRAGPQLLSLSVWTLLALLVVLVMVLPPQLPSLAAFLVVVVVTTSVSQNSLGMSILIMMHSQRRKQYYTI